MPFANNLHCINLRYSDTLLLNARIIRYGVMTGAKIQNLIEELDNLDLSPQIYKYNVINDEPKFNFINTDLKISQKVTDGFIIDRKSHGSGASYFSKEEAL